MAGRIIDLQGELDRLQADLFHVDAVLRLFGLLPEDIPTKGRVPKRSTYFGRNEITRRCYDMLREREIVSAWISSSASLCRFTTCGRAGRWRRSDTPGANVRFFPLSIVTARPAADATPPGERPFLPTEQGAAHLIGVAPDMLEVWRTKSRRAGRLIGPRWVELAGEGIVRVIRYVSVNPLHTTCGVRLPSLWESSFVPNLELVGRAARLACRATSD